MMTEARHLLANSFRRLGAYLIPTSFTIGRPGSDIHYAATLPMTAKPKLGQTNQYGELEGASNINIVDGSSLSSLTAKSHTLTIMANADRIGKHIAEKLTALAENRPKSN
jgi:choline dehydrogenase-like flavoprotein